MVVAFTIGDHTTLSPSNAELALGKYLTETIESTGLVTLLISLLLLVVVMCAVSIMAGASRVTWAFAQDSGLPLAKFLSRVSVFKVS